ncbi:multicopper oxidase domain-containing protein [Zafaria sp. J156]|uniref:multicopper oxidase domain-containing protein n=1 Tax=Zafaria sp. J156 TaxID=3116490 RepID=UPI002E76D197|nr:multicopper oxidase domain-containing protein [Zafaria sp. J156]MEE1621721.1 multicopper oxidase domain-containing protein [Zafaria sp. J156]
MTTHENPLNTALDRASVLKLGAAGAAVVSFVGLNRPPAPAARRVSRTVPAALVPQPGVLDLYVNEGYQKMVDDSLVYQRGFGDRPTIPVDRNAALRIQPRVFTRDGQVLTSRIYPVNAIRPNGGTPLPLSPDPANPGQHFIRRNYWASFLPNRTIVAETGSTVRLRVVNRLADVHELLVGGAGPGASDVTTGPIEPGGVGELEFPAPPPGTYIYHDPTNAPVQRAIGLFGTLLVMDPDDAWKVAPDQASFERQWLWVCHAIDPGWAESEAAGVTVDPVARPPVPRYFLLNDRSGFEALAHSPNRSINLAAHEESLVSGYARQIDVRQFGEDIDAGTVRAGQMVRLVNPGLVFHQIHFHGNHLWTVRRNNVEWPREYGWIDDDGHVVLQQWEDVVELEPMDRKDCMIPMKRPPDTTDQTWYGRTEDWGYPMHCHAEPSQTAAGGMYPGGLVAHWQLKASL